MFDHFAVPFLVSNCLNARLRFPQLYPVGHFGLKCFQLFAGIFRAITAEVHTFGCCALRHRALALAVEAALFSPAAIALHFLKGSLKALGQGYEPRRVLTGPNKYAAGWAEQPAYGSQFLVRLCGWEFLFLHDTPFSGNHDFVLGHNFNADSHHPPRRAV